MSETKARSPAVGKTRGASKFDGLGRHVISQTSLFQNFRQAISAELIGSNQASAAGIVAIGHAPVSKLCRRLIEAAHNPDLPLEVYRGTTLCLRVRSIAEGAALSVEDDENGRPRFVRHRPRTCGAAPYVAQAVRPVP